MNEFYATRAGRTFFDVTMPGLVSELARMNALPEKLVEQRPAQVADPREQQKP